MKETAYNLSAEINGITKLVFFAPTRKQLRFAQSVKQSVMRAIMSSVSEADLEKARTSAAKNKKGASDKDEMLDGSALYTILQSGKEDVCDLLEKFIAACTDSSLCHANGAPVPEEVWDEMTVADIEGAFKEYIGNFITT